MDISDRITRAESGGKRTAKAPTSSALGLGQFINGTWLDMIRRYHPELMERHSRDEILAMRTNPELSREMTAKYAAENEARLRQAGVPVTPTSTYLMHFAGPGGGVKLMKADPNTPVESILDDNAIQANPFLRGKTASWVIAWANKKMAGAAASKPSGVPQWGAGGQPIPSLAQTQAVEPAFGATGWPAHPASPNVLSPDSARPFSGAAGAASIPFVDETVRAQQALDNSLPAPGAAPWDLSDRFGKWNGLGGVFGPANAGGSGGRGRTGDGNGLGVRDARFRQADVNPSTPMQHGTAAEISGGMPSLPPAPFPLEALLAPDPSRGLNEWASSSRRRSAPSAVQGAAIGLVDPMASAAGTNPPNPDRASTGGLLSLIQDYMRYNAS